MGGTSSRAVAQKAARPLKNYNVEERARKTIEKHKVKPVAAPRHATSKAASDHEKQVSENLGIKEELQKQDTTLIDRMNKLHVDMVDDQPKFKSDRPLPQRRDNIYSDPLHAFEEPRNVPVGMITLRQLESILKQSKEDPSTHTAEIIAKDYNIKLEEASNILKYFENIDLTEKPEADNTPPDLEWQYDASKDESIQSIPPR